MEPSKEIKRGCNTCVHQALSINDAPAHCWDCSGSISRPHWEAFTPAGIPIYAVDSQTKPAQLVLDKQVGGNHYKEAGNNMQPWEIARAWRLGAWRHGVLKYILRAPAKNGVQDIEKAIHYLEYIKANYNELKEEGLL